MSKVWKRIWWGLYFREFFYLLSIGEGNFHKYNLISRLLSIMIYKHYFTFEEIQKMSLFDFTFYSELVTNVLKEINEAIKHARLLAQQNQ